MATALNKILLFGFIMSLPGLLQAQEHVLFSLYLVGDAGEAIKPDDSTLLFLRSGLAETSHASAVIFLGDNIYPEGLPDTGHTSYRDAEYRLLQQLNALKGYTGAAYVIPGNHDWKRGRKGGLDHVRNQEEYVHRFASNENLEIKLLPKPGYFGPDFRDHRLGNGISMRILFLDTQWWLHKHRVLRSSGGTRKEELDSCLRQTEKLIREAAELKMPCILVAHHPLTTFGVHESSNIFKGIGAGAKYRRQNTSNNHYQHYSKAMIEIMNRNPGILYAAGHDHNFQFFETGKGWQLISGAGSKTQKEKVKLEKKAPARLAARESGFLCYDFNAEGYVVLDYLASGISRVVMVTGRNRKVMLEAKMPTSP